MRIDRIEAGIRVTETSIVVHWADWQRFMEIGGVAWEGKGGSGKRGFPDEGLEKARN